MAGINVGGRVSTTRGRLALFFAVRYLMPATALLALASSPDVSVDRRRLAAMLTAQIAFALAAQTLAGRRPALVRVAVWGSILADILIVSALVDMTGGAGGPLTFLYTVEALAAGILLSAATGLRVLLAATAAILAIDAIAAQGAGDGGLVRGLEAVAALWIIGGAAILFSAFNERELRRRNAELAAVRRVALDIEETLSLEDVLADLCRGVVEGFRFDAALVLLRGEDGLSCAGAHGVAGIVGRAVEERGVLAGTIVAGRPAVVSSAEALRDGGLVDLLERRGYVAVPLNRDGVLVTTRGGRRGRPGRVRGHEIEAITRLAHHASLAVANARLHARVSEMAVTDPLTGLFNHGEFQRRVAHELGRLARYAKPGAAGHHVSLMLVDIDHFKSVNDRFGHRTGDAVLRGVADAMRGAVRSFDIAARYGGEEFAIILPETDAEGARAVAERLRESVQGKSFLATDREEELPAVTVSVGIATAPGNGWGPAELISVADTALYRSKKEGRNCVTHALDGARRLAEIVTLEGAVKRRRREAGEARAGGAWRRARGRSSLPRRRTPRG